LENILILKNKIDYKILLLITPPWLCQGGIIAQQKKGEDYE